MNISFIDRFHYAWRDIVPDAETPDEFRMLVPHSDPYLYETPIDFIFESPEAAVQGLKDFGVFEEAVEEGWVLVVVATSPYNKTIQELVTSNG